MSGFTGSFEENPPGGGPFDRGFQAACPACGENVSYEILLDLYKTSCPGCGKYAILFFWGKEEGPHLTEDLAYMFLEEGLLSEENIETALETKKQTGPMPFVEFLLSIQYVTVSQLEELARRLIPDDWGKQLAGEEYRQPPSPDTETESEQLARSDVDAIYALIDQIYSGCEYPFSKMRSVDLERLIRSLGGDLVAGAIRTRFGRMILDPDRFSADLTDRSFARCFSDAFELEYEESTAPGSNGDLSERQEPELFQEYAMLPLTREEDILHVGIAGHLIGLGFGELFDLASPQSLRNALHLPVSFRIMPLTRIENGLRDRFQLQLDQDLDELTNLLSTVAGELSDELISRYRNLDPDQRPVTAGEEREHPSPVLNAIFKSLPLGDVEREPSPTSGENKVIRSWLYHPDASRVIPEVMDRNKLDELLLWGENQVIGAESESLPEVPDGERDEFNRLCQALNQLHQTGEVRPELLNLPADILDGVSELEAGIYDAVPIARAGGFYWFCVAGDDPDVVRELSALTSEDVRALNAEPEGIGELLVRWYGVRKGEWMPGPVEASIEQFYGLSPMAEEDDLPAPDPETVQLVPRHVADELGIVPLVRTPEEIMVACTERPVFVDRQMLRILVRRSISYRFVRKNLFDDLFDRAYPEPPEEELVPDEDVPADAGQWERESVEELLGAPLVLEEIETPRRLLAELEEKKEKAPEVRIITDPEEVRTYPSVFQRQGKLHVDEELMEKISGEHWTPAMETFFPAIPLRDRSPELIFVSSSLDRRWLLETLGLFTNHPVHVLILPKSALQKISSPYDHPDGNGKYGGGSTNGGTDAPSGKEDESSYIRYESPHLFESFHELAEQNQLKKLLLLLLVYLLEHPRCEIYVQSDRDRCHIYREDREGSEELMSIESAHTYAIRYAIQELAGESLRDFRSDQQGDFRFIFQGRPYRISFQASSVPDGQKLTLSTEIPAD